MCPDKPTKKKREVTAINCVIWAWVKNGDAWDSFDEQTLSVLTLTVKSAKREVQVTETHQLWPTLLYYCMNCKQGFLSVNGLCDAYKYLDWVNAFFFYCMLPQNLANSVGISWNCQKARNYIKFCYTLKVWNNSDFLRSLFGSPRLHLFDAKV